MFGEMIRRVGFWTLDALKGGKVRTRMKHLKKVREDRRGNAEALEAILQHAIDTVPAYKNVKKAEISAFPVVSKVDYRNNFESYRSELYLDERGLHKVFTSGSTGTPFMAYQDQEKLLWHRAGLMNLNERIGWHLGDRFLFMRMWRGTHANTPFARLVSNTVPIEVCGFDEEHAEQVRRRILRDKKLCLILGYASAVEILAKHILQAGDAPADLGIRLVIADSECLTDRAKTTIAKAFNCPVLDRYGNNENGILGLTMDNSRVMEVNFPEYCMEILKLDSDMPAAQGELGRIVITDLYNKAFPFIRYDTGDVGIAAEMYGNQCLRLASLGGRSASVLTATDGAKIGETGVTSFFEDVVGIGRWQLAQTDVGRYELRLEDTDEQMDSILHQRCLNCFGADAQVVIRHVEKVPQEKNGKYKILVDEIGVY